MHKADLIHTHSDLQSKLEEIYALRRTRSKVNWDRDQFLKLLKKFDDPHLELPPVIHVAGTNGKGSVISMLRSILTAQGYKVHVYTSPHLIDVNERIVLAGQEISNAQLSDLIDHALEFSDGAPLSFFEIMTAIAFRTFADEPADVLLLEVGMGGRLDCTNVIEQPIATVINRVSMDHTDFLGDRLDVIAAEKAGIMKRDVPCLIGSQSAGIHQVMQDKAEEVGAFILSDWSVDKDMNFSFEGERFSFPMPSLQGNHQVKNAGLALATLFAVRDHLPVSHDSITDGLQNVQWPARLQKIDPDIYGLSDAYDIWLDSGHNDSAGKALAMHIQGTDQPVFLVLGMLKTKGIDLFLKPLRPLVQEIYVVPIASNDCFSASDIEGACDCDSVEQALKEISERSPEACVLISGSVYLAGEVLKTLRSPH